MTRCRFLVSVAAAAFLTACGSPTRDSNVNGPEETDLTDADSHGEARALARAVKAGDFTEIALGGRVGNERKTALRNETGIYADMRSYVACPHGMRSCDPRTAPAGTVYTYVLVVTPGEDNDPDRGSGSGPDNSRVERATAFRMTMPAHGFNGQAGYAKPEALAALGKRGDVVITCDAGKLIWTLSSGDGGDQWEYQEPITFYWRSTLPPGGPANAYELHADYTFAKGEGAYPIADERAPNACSQPPG